jgi:hypothetical protein
MRPGMSSSIEEPTVAPVSPKPKVIRMNVLMAEGHYEELKSVAAESGTDVSEFVRTAVRLYIFLQKEKGKGKSVYVGQNDKAEKEIVIP